MNIKMFSLSALLAIAFAACNSDADNKDGEDTTITDVSSTTSSGNYAALADSFRTNSEAGNYLDARTGKTIKLTYDPDTRRAINVETGEPVWRYVDRRTWWVYGDNNDNWETMGEAKIEGGKVMYRDGDTWVTYEDRWLTEDERIAKEWKEKYGDTKVKVSKDGDIKVKDEKGKIKYDADDNKIKVDTSD